jgi:hypothetical protein
VRKIAQKWKIERLTENHRKQKKPKEHKANKRTVTSGMLLYGLSGCLYGLSPISFYSLSPLPNHVSKEVFRTSIVTTFCSSGRFGTPENLPI